MSNSSKRGHNAASKPGEVGFQPIALDEPATTNLTAGDLAPTLGVNAAFHERLAAKFPTARTLDVNAFIDENTEQTIFSVRVYDTDGLELSPQAVYDYDTGQWDTSDSDEFTEWTNTTLFTGSDAEAFIAEHLVNSTYVDGTGYYIDLTGAPATTDSEDRPSCNGRCLNGRDMGGPEHTNMVYPHPDCPKHQYGDRLDAYDPEYVGHYKNNGAAAYDWVDSDGEPPF